MMMGFTKFLTSSSALLAAAAALLLILPAVTAYNDELRAEDQHDFDKLMTLVSRPRVLDRYKTHEHQPKHVSPVTSFSWSDCGATSDPIHVSSIKLSPDPLKIPGNVTVAFSGSLSVPLKAPIQLDLKVEKKMVFWITIPCVDDIGSCDYEDACVLLQQIPCPPEFPKYGIPCSCPFKAGNYSLPSATVLVDPVGIPSWLSDGDYKITLTFKQQGKEIACLHFELSITK